jgi:hypothetical protein
VSPHHLRRWLIAIVVIAGLALAGAGRSDPSAGAVAGGDGGPATTAVVAPGWGDDQGVIPVKPQIDAASGSERGIRVKLPVLLGAVAAVAFAVATGPRGCWRHHTSRPSLTLRTRYRPRRAPPLLLG